MSKKIERYKCPKCGYTDAEPGYCDNCGYKGEVGGFKAKEYIGTFKVKLYVVAYNKKDAKKELNETKTLYGIDHLNHELIEIKEEGN